jgi:hypothetical protein
MRHVPRRKSEFKFDDTRFSELSRIVRHRYDGAALPETPETHALAMALITHRKPDDKLRWLTRFCKERAPWLDVDEIDLSNLPWRNARALGYAIGLTAAERERLHIKTIAPYDQTDTERAAVSKQRKRLRDRERRRLEREARNGITRSAWLALNSLMRDKPWQSEGISRAQWYRRRARQHGLDERSEPSERARPSRRGLHRETGTATIEKIVLGAQPVSSLDGAWRPSLAVLMEGSGTLH